MPAVLLGLALLAGCLMIAWWFSRADPKQVAVGLRTVIVILAVVVGLWLLFVGRHALAGLIPIIAVVAWRYGPALLARGKAAGQGRRYGRESGVRTAFLAMTLDHVTGEASGEVLSGNFAGRRLESLSLPEVLALRGEVAGDAQSLALLEAWLDRRFPDWRHAEGGAAGDGHAGASGPMTRDEALAILGLEESATAEEIKAAHRRLMQKLHPDHGGSNYLAAKLNQAKALLLGESS